MIGANAIGREVKPDLALELDIGYGSDGLAFMQAGIRTALSPITPSFLLPPLVVE